MSGVCLARSLRSHLRKGGYFFSCKRVQVSQVTRDVRLTCDLCNKVIFVSLLFGFHLDFRTLERVLHMVKTKQGNKKTIKI